MAGSFPSPNDIRLYTAWSKGKSQPPDCVPPIQTIPDILHGSYLLFGAISRFIAYALLDILVPRAPIEYQTHGSVSSIFFVKIEDFFIYFLCRFYSVFMHIYNTIYGLDCRGSAPPLPSKNLSFNSGQRPNAPKTLRGVIPVAPNRRQKAAAF